MVKRVLRSDGLQHKENQEKLYMASLSPYDICLRIEDRWLNKRREGYRDPSGV